MKYTYFTNRFVGSRETSSQVTSSLLFIRQFHVLFYNNSRHFICMSLDTFVYYSRDISYLLLERLFYKIGDLFSMRFFSPFFFIDLTYSYCTIPVFLKPLKLTTSLLIYFNLKYCSTPSLPSTLISQSDSGLIYHGNYVTVPKVEFIRLLVTF